jgi:hypothetical protein
MASQISEKAMESMIETMIKGVDPEQIKILSKTFDIPTINIWLKHCQENAGKGTNHGYVHEDLVNLLGERLGFNVTYGKHTSGVDGIWKYGKLSIAIESKANIQWKGTLTEIMKFVSQEHTDYGLVVSSSFDDEDLNTVKGPTYSTKLRLITTEALCKLASLKADNVLETENVKDVLIPQESHLLDNVIDLIYGIRQQVVKPKTEVVEVSEEEQEKLSQVPKSIEDYSDDLRAVYIILKENPNEWYDPSDLAEEIKQKFPKTFVQKTAGQIAFTFPYGGMWLEKKGLLQIKKDEYGRRSYKFKLSK